MKIPACYSCSIERCSAAGKDVEGVAHEIWAVAQLSPGEGIEDGVERILEILKDTFFHGRDPSE